MPKKNLSPQQIALIDEKYNWRDLPKPKNFLLHSYRCALKLFWIFFIGFGAVILSTITFPLLKIFVHPAARYKRSMKFLVTHSFKFFVFLLKISCVTDVKCDGKDKLKVLKSKVVVANHPSMLDIVMLISLIPGATVIAGENYTHTPLGGVIKACYIINSLDFDEMCRRCKKCLDEGENVIIFPEGTRTPRHGSGTYKKGAARIAKAAGANILPILIAGSDKFGLGKHNPFWSYNPVEKLFYHIIPLEEIDIGEYTEMDDPAAAKRITQKIYGTIKDAAEKYRENHPYTQTVNNV